MIATRVPSVPTGLEGPAWERALRVVERTVLAPLRVSGMFGDDIGLSVTEAEHPERRGMPSIRIGFGCASQTTVVHLDWHGSLSWGRTQMWLSCRTHRAIARRRWILAMGEAGNRTVPLDRRTADPLLARWIRDGRLSLETLGAGVNGWPPGGRYEVNGRVPGVRVAHLGHETCRVEVAGLPRMEIHVDHDRVMLYSMTLSQEVVLLQRPDERPSVRIAGHRIPETAALAMRGRPLHHLIHSDLLDPGAMPMISRIEVKAATIRAWLERTPEEAFRCQT